MAACSWAVGAFVFEDRAGPLQARDDRFKQPFHAQGVVMDAAQIDVGRDFAIRQRPVELLGAGFRHAQIAEAIEVLVLDGNFPAAARFVGLPFDDVLHDFLPGAGAQFGIGAVDVNPGQREVEVGLALGFVVGLEAPLGLGPVAGLEAGLLSSGFVFEVIDAPGALNQTELLLHCFTHGYEWEAVGTVAMSEQWASGDRAVAEFCKGCQRGEDSGEDSTLRGS